MGVEEVELTVHLGMAFELDKKFIPRLAPQVQFRSEK